MNFITSIFFMLVISNTAFAIDLNAGLWEIKMKIVQDGKATDPMAQLRKSMENMSEEQKKQMMKIMGKHVGTGLSDKNLTACYTKEMLNTDRAFNVRGNGECNTKILKKTDTEIKSAFTCKDGSKGSAHWKIKNSSAYSSTVQMTDAKGKKSDLIYDMKHLRADCGDVKPMKFDA